MTGIGGQPAPPSAAPLPKGLDAAPGPTPRMVVRLPPDLHLLLLRSGPLTATVEGRTADGLTLLRTGERTLALPLPPEAASNLARGTALLIRASAALARLEALVTLAPAAPRPTEPSQSTPSAGPARLRPTALLLVAAPAMRADRPASELQPGDRLIMRPPQSAARPVPALVVANAPSGSTTLATPFGQVTLKPDLLLTPGRLLPVLSASPLPAPLSAVANPARTLATLGSAWPTLDRLHADTAQAAPAAAARLAAMLPALQSGPAMLAELILFMSAARRVDPAQWLGEELLQSLRETAGGETVGRMLEDFARIGRLPDADGPWQSWLIPFWAGDTVRQLRVHFRRRDEERDAETGQRFLLETELSRLGALQIDGFFRSRHLRLMLRSRTPLPQPARSGIEAAFLGRLGADGLTGEIAFDGSGRFVIVASETEGGSGLLV